MGHGGGSAVLGSPQVEHLPSWGMEYGKNLSFSIRNCQCPMPNAQCPMPNN
ncbi:hypothetical protein [Tolypothrix sp. VBCCA 56010]|uniref:hypothetical protein n=1 Tax=Tolypothrix sp. VBCCA 56010 TaxID=3137731 RepID=UPI003D7EE52B